jgi:hypothetical protein
LHGVKNHSLVQQKMLLANGISPTNKMMKFFKIKGSKSEMLLNTDCPTGDREFKEQWWLVIDTFAKA